MAKVITKLPAKQSLAEIYQSMNLHLALVKPTEEKDVYERITAFVKCRDFLCDVYSFSKAKMDFSIYSMKFAGSKESPDYDAVYLMAQFPDKDAKKSFLEHMELLKEIEKKNDFEVTTVVTLEGTEDVVLLGDKKWLASCLTFSLYTFLLRVLCYKFANKKDWLKEFAKEKHSDSRYVESIHADTWKKILDDLSVLNVKPWCGLDPKTMGTSAVHHNSGFVSVFGSHTEISIDSVKKNEHWKHFKELGFKLSTN